MSSGAHGRGALPQLAAQGVAPGEVYVSEKMMLDHLEEMLLRLGLRLSRSHSVRDRLPLSEQGLSNLSHTLGPGES